MVKKSTKGAVAILALIPIVFVVFLFLIKVLWGWVIPDLFPGAVEQGLIAENISLATAGKLSLFMVDLFEFKSGN